MARPAISTFCSAVSILGIAVLAATAFLERRRRPTIELGPPTEVAQNIEPDPAVA